LALGRSSYAALCVHRVSASKFTIVLLLALASLWANAQRKAAAIEGIELAAERHHKLTLQNEKLRVFTVELPSGGYTQFVRHEKDFLLLALTDSQLQLVPERGAGQRLRMGPGELQLGTAGLVKRIVNQSSESVRFLVIEIIQGIEPKLAICGLRGPQCESDLGDLRGPNVSTSGLFETPTVKVSRTELDPKGVLSQHTHKYDHLVVALSELSLRSDVPDKGGSEIQQKRGDVAWVPAGLTHTLTNTGESRAAFLALEIKQ
jgi:quercetin dioxygenase-like cupin family protein